MRKLIFNLYTLLFNSGSAGRNVKLLLREFKFFWQRLTRGFGDDELWSLDDTIAEFILPRLKAFTKQRTSHPTGLTEEEWNNMLEEMILSFQLIKDDEAHNIEKRDTALHGLELFSKYFFHLWD